MIRTLVAGAALAGTLTLGAAGAAGAASTTTPTPASTTTHATACARADKLATRIHTREGKAATWLAKAQGRETTATSGNHPKLAKAIARRIARVQKREARANKLLAKITAKCGATTPS